MFTAGNNASTCVPPGAVIARCRWAESRRSFFLRGTNCRLGCLFLSDQTILSIIKRSHHWCHPSRPTFLTTNYCRVVILINVDDWAVVFQVYRHRFYTINNNIMSTKWALVLWSVWTVFTYYIHNYIITNNGFNRDWFQYRILLRIYKQV